MIYLGKVREMNRNAKLGEVAEYYPWNESPGNIA